MSLPPPTSPGDQNSPSPDYLPQSPQSNFPQSVNFQPSSFPTVNPQQQQSGAYSPPQSNYQNPPPQENPQSETQLPLYKVMDGTEEDWKRALTRQKDSGTVVCVTAFVGLLAFCLSAFALQPIFLGAIAAMGIASGAASIATLIAIAVTIATVVGATAGYITHRIQEYYSSKPAKEYAAMSNPEFERIFSAIIKKEIFTELQNAAEALQGKPDNPNLMENFKIKLKAFQNAFQKFCEYTHAVIMPFIPDPIILTENGKDSVNSNYLGHVIYLTGMYNTMVHEIKKFGMIGYASLIGEIPIYSNKNKLSYRGKQLNENQCLKNARGELKKLIAAIKNRDPAQANDAIRAYNEYRYGFCVFNSSRFGRSLVINFGFNSSLLRLSDKNIASIEKEINKYINCLDDINDTKLKNFRNFMEKLYEFGILGNGEFEYRCISPDLCKKWKEILKKINNGSSFEKNKNAFEEFLRAVRDAYPDAHIPEIDFRKLENDKNKNLEQLAKNISGKLNNNTKFSLDELINTTNSSFPLNDLWTFVKVNSCGIDISKDANANK
ncbi:MAG: hypothetical protein LBI69_00120 [Puniceicoccales bacterium]|jgi:hypothetical protein|nr:hypothetical protein [Puniceicoccales bacterium]